MPTTEQVARLAGVSRATVSRVLNGSSSVRDETKKRIFAAISTLGYERRMSVLGGAWNRSRTIGLQLFQDEHGLNFSQIHQTQYYFFLGVLREIERAIAEADYDLLIPTRTYDYCDGNDNPRTNYIRSLEDKHVEGIIAVGINWADPRVQALTHSDIPTVFLDSMFQGKFATSIKSDYMDGARQAVEHLLQLGHQRIACFPGDPITSTGAERLLGYQRTLAQAGCSIDPALICPSGWNTDDAYAATFTLFSTSRDFTAIFAASDMMAFGILRALRELQVRVPEDISVVGFDDIDLSQKSDPPLTTIRQDPLALSQKSVSALLQTIENKSTAPSPLILPTQLVVRTSTAPYPPGI
jgi:DNA-binding LacI/PurR family transcriptional regulator